jgi:hypothetical protein
MLPMLIAGFVSHTAEHPVLEQMQTPQSTANLRLAIWQHAGYVLCFCIQACCVAAARVRGLVVASVLGLTTQGSSIPKAQVSLLGAQEALLFSIPCVPLHIKPSERLCNASYIEFCPASGTIMQKVMNVQTHA